jgi:hypothetical protein
VYAVHITFTSRVAAEETREGAIAFAGALQSVPGFVAKYWLHTGAHHGGFYLFTDQASAEAYRDGPLVAGLREHPAFDDVEVRGWDVDEELGALTGTARTAAA